MRLKNILSGIGSYVGRIITNPFQISRPHPDDFEPIVEVAVALQSDPNKIRVENVETGQDGAFHMELNPPVKDLETACNALVLNLLPLQVSLERGCYVGTSYGPEDYYKVLLYGDHKTLVLSPRIVGHGGLFKKLTELADKHE